MEFQNTGSLTHLRLGFFREIEKPPKEKILQLFRKKKGHVQRIRIHNGNRLPKAILEARRQWKNAFKILRKHHYLHLEFHTLKGELKDGSRHERCKGFKTCPINL